MGKSLRAFILKLQHFTSKRDINTLEKIPFYEIFYASFLQAISWRWDNVKHRKRTKGNTCKELNHE